MKFKVLSIAGMMLAALALTSGNASAGVIINFIELPNEAGIHLSGFDISGNPISVTKLNSETFHLSSPIVFAGYPADATLARIGVTRVGRDFLVNILESVNGPISDQVFVHRLGTNLNFTVIDFISDPDQFFTGITPFATVIEDGTLQHVLDYTNDVGDLVSINVQSDVVPEPTSIAMLGTGALGLLFAARKRRQTKLAA